MGLASLPLAEYQPRSMLKTPEHPVRWPKFPVIDMHNHSEWAGSWQVTDVPALLGAMDEARVVARVDLDGGVGARLHEHLRRFREPYPERFVVFASCEWDRYLTYDDFGKRLAEDLRGAVKEGAEGLKVWKELGLTLRDNRGQRLTVDDDRLRPLFDAAGELDIPVLIHVADPMAFFTPLDARNERYEELVAHPDWHFYGPGIPSFDDLQDAFDRLLARHPGTRFVGAHCASLAEDLGRLGELLTRHAALSVDIAARAAELGRQPRTAAAFFEAFQDRIVFGLDAWPAAAADYQVVYRLLETADEYFSYNANPDAIPGQGRWQIYGLDLPIDVLRQVYYGNAVRLIPRLRDSLALEGFGHGDGPREEGSDTR